MGSVITRTPFLFYWSRYEQIALHAGIALLRQLSCSRCIAVLGFQPHRELLFYRRGSGFHPLYRGTWFPTSKSGRPGRCRTSFPSAISRYLVPNLPLFTRSSFLLPSFHPLYRGTWFPTAAMRITIRKWLWLFPSAISRYLVPDPTRKTPPLTSGGGNGLHTPRRIDHIPTFASLNHDKNTRSTHYTPNAGIELSETTPPPLQVNLVQNWV